MKQLAVVSGKGGTGKTTLVASLAQLAGHLVTVDCDVDAANLALLLSGKDGPAEDFFAGQVASIDPELCNGCGLCASFCRFDAIESTVGEPAKIRQLLCEGCGVCHTICPVKAVTLRPNHAGVWTRREAATGPLIHARLDIAQGNSGKLVARVRDAARAVALEQSLDLVLIDGPPGIGCPVHAAVTGVDLLLAVTEPTPSGLRDLGRILKLAQSFQLKSAVLINKADLSERYEQRTRQLAKSLDARIVGRLPFDARVPRLLAQGSTPLSLDSMARELQETWRRISAMLLEVAGPAPMEV